nr:copia protein [Tanacetum cinerariifolium]
MLTQQDIYAAGSENRPPMLKKDNYVPWSFRIIRYARSRPNGKMIVDSIENGPYVRSMTFPKMNQEEVNELRAERLAKSHEPLALMAHSQNSFNFPITHKDQSSSSTHSQQSFPINNKYNPQPSLNQNFMQPPMTSLKDINDPTEAINTTLILFAKAFQLTAPTNNNQRKSSNPHNRQIAQPVMNISQGRQTQNVRGNGGNQFGQYARQVAPNQQGYNIWQNGGIQGAQNAVQNAGVQSGGNQNGLVVVPGVANKSGTGNVVAARAEGTRIRNQARCYNCRGLGHIARNCTARPRRRDAAYLQTQLLIPQKEEAGIQLQAEEFDFMAVAGDLDEIKEVNANYILMDNLQHASTSGTQFDKAPEEQYADLLEPIPEPQLVLQNDNHVTSVASSMVQSEGTVETSFAPNEETRAHQETVYRNLVDQVAQVNMVNCNMRATNAELKSELARYRNQEQRVEISQEKYDKLEKCYQKSVYQEQYLTRKINALHLSSTKQITTLNDEISNLNKQLSKEKSSISSLMEEKKKLKHDFKTREDKFIDKKVNLEAKIKDLENILLKRDQTEADESLDKQKSLELKIKRLLKASVCHDIMSIVQNGFVDVPSDLQTELDRKKEKLELCIIKKEKEYAILWNNWPQPKGNTRNARVLSASKSSEVKKNVTVEYHRRTLLLSKNLKTMSSKCNNIKLAIQNNTSEIVYDTYKQCLVTAYHDACFPSSVNALNSRANNLCDNVSLSANQKRHRTQRSPSGGTLASLEIWMVLTCLKAIVLQISTPSIFMTWPQLLPYVSWPMKLSHGYGINDYPISTSTPSTTLPRMISSLVYQSLNMPKNIFVPLVSKEKVKEPLTHPNRVYNQRTKKIMETINITFNELSAMAFEQNSSRPGLQSMTSGQTSSELKLTYAQSTITPQRPSKRDMDILFEPFHNEYLGGRPSEALRAIPAAPMVQNLQALTASMSFQDSTPVPTNSLNIPVSSHNVNGTSQQHAQQQRNLTSSPTVSAADNVPNAMFEGDLFVNPSATPSTERFDDDILVVQVYVDDIIFGSTDPRYATLFSDLMKSRFEMSMIGEMTFFIGLQVNQSPSGIFINQSNYANKILKKYRLNTCDIVGTPMDIKDKLDLDQIGTSVDATEYRSMIGSLMYLTSSRPGIVHATCDSGFELTRFSYTDYARCKDTFKSTSGGAQFFGEKLMSWSSKKQDCTSLSTAESEYVSLSACCAQVLWMRTQLTDYGYHFDKIPIYCDSKSAITISCNPVQHSRMKHIAV